MVNGLCHGFTDENGLRKSILAFWREKVLRELGLRVVRFRNDEVVRNLSAAAGKIRDLVE